MRALRFYFLVAACGGVLMALEILSSRLLSPHFGSSVYVWGSIISVFLAALSLGYVAGGQLADRFPSFAALGRLVVLAATLLGGLLLWGEPLVAALGRATGGSPAGTLLAAGVLFGPVSVLFGMVSPWAVRLAARDLDHLGHQAGRLYALSTAGSLLGTLACTFLLIPFLTLEQVLALLLALTAATGGVALLGPFSAGTARREGPALLLTVALLALAGSHARPRESYAGALYRRITPYQTLQVAEVDGERYLESDRVVQAGIRIADGKPALNYIRIAPAALLFKPDIERGLLLGLGAGSCARVMREVKPGMSFDYVEIDPAVPEVAGRFLGFAPAPGDVLTIDDARRFLRRSERRWDFIFADTYVGRAVPFHLATVEFFRLVRDRLTPDGVLALNLAGGLGSPFTRAMYRTLAEVFPQLYAFRAPRLTNVVVLATQEESRAPREALLAAARQLDAAAGLEVPATLMVEKLYLEVDLELLGAHLLTDELAPVERLVQISAGEDELLAPQR